MTPPHKKTRKKKKKKRALFDRKDEDRVTAKATEAVSGTDGDRRFTFVQYADEKQSGRQPAANVDKAEILLIEEEEEVVVESPRLTEKNSGEEEEDEDDVIEIVLDDDVDEKPADHGSEPRLVLLSVEEQLAMIEEEARQIQVSSQNFVVDPADRGFI